MTYPFSLIRRGLVVDLVVSIKILELFGVGEGTGVNLSYVQVSTQAYIGESEHELACTVCAQGIRDVPVIP